MQLGTGNAKTAPTGVVVDVDEYSASGTTMLKDITKIIKGVVADKEGASCSALSREIKVRIARLTARVCHVMLSLSRSLLSFSPLVSLSLSLHLYSVCLQVTMHWGQSPNHSVLIVVFWRVHRNKLKQSMDRHGSASWGLSFECTVRTPETR